MSLGDDPRARNYVEDGVYVRKDFSDYLIATLNTFANGQEIDVTRLDEDAYVKRFEAVKNGQAYSLSQDFNGRDWISEESYMPRDGMDYIDMYDDLLENNWMSEEFWLEKELRS